MNRMARILLTAGRCDFMPPLSLNVLSSVFYPLEISPWTIMQHPSASRVLHHSVSPNFSEQTSQQIWEPNEWLSNISMCWVKKRQAFS